MEYEFTADGHLVPSARTINEARQAFLNGDLDPLLALKPSLSVPSTVAPSPHLSRLLIDILSGKIKRPNRHPTTTKPLTITEITWIGIRVQGAIKMGDRTRCMDVLHCCIGCKDELDGSRWHSMNYEDAIKEVAKGIPDWVPPSKPTGPWDLEPPEGFDAEYLPPIPLNRVKAAYAAFLKMQSEPRPWDTRPTTPKRSRQKPSPRTTRSSSKK